MQCFQFNQGSPDADLGAIVFNVTGLPDITKIKEVGRIRAPNSAISSGTAARCSGTPGCSIPGGFHNVFPYRHSDGRTLLFTTTLSGTYASIYDMAKFLAGAPDQGFISRVPVPGATGRYHDFVVAYDPVTHQDKSTEVPSRVGTSCSTSLSREEPKLLTSIVDAPDVVVSGFGRGHTITPTPDGRYVVTETEYQYSPLRVFDLMPGLQGKVQTITRPLAAWTANWRDLPHNHEIRWPYVFVSAYEDGLQVFNMLDPTNPITVGYYRTYDGPHEAGVTHGGAPRYRRGQPACRQRDGAQRGVGDRCAERRRPDRDQRHHNRILGAPHGWIRWLGWAQLGHAQHFDCTGLGERTRGRSQTESRARIRGDSDGRRSDACDTDAAVKRRRGTGRSLRDDGCSPRLGGLRGLRRRSWSWPR